MDCVSSPSLRCLRLACFVLGMVLPVRASAQCDLKADFIYPTGSSEPGGQSANWTLRFINVAATGTCAANNVRLVRYAGSSASGTATAIGGTGALKALPALAPQDSATLSFPELSTPTTGTHTYKPVYASPHNDANNFNHHPTRTVGFQASPTYSLPPDLTVLRLLPVSPGIRVGACNTLRVSVRNLGGNLVGRSVLRLLVYRPGLPGTVVHTASLPLGDFLPTASRDLEFRGVNVPQSGPWRFDAVADAADAITESNEANTRSTMDFTNVATPC